MATDSMVRSSATDDKGRPRPSWRPRVPGLVAWAVRITAVLTVLDLMVPAGRHPFSDDRHRFTARALNGMVDGVTLAAAVFAAGFLLVLATALRRRKLRAWRLATAAVVVSIVTHALVHRWVVVAINLAVLGLLIWARRDFTARSERSGRLLAVRVFGLMLVVSVTAGMFLTARTAPTSPWTSRLVEVLSGLVGFTPELEFRRQYSSDLTEIALNTLGALTALLTVVTFLAPARKPARLSESDESDLRALLAKFGNRDSLGYFALRGDKTAIFSPSRKAAVVYRVTGGVSLASGDPLGDPEAWPGAIAAWLEEADTYGWTPGVIAASEEGAIAYQRAGLDSYELGDEAVLDLTEFTLEGRSMRVVRQAVNRVKRAGYTLDVQRQSELSEADLEEVERVAEALRGEDVERGFSMALGRLGDARDPEMVIARARDTEGRMVGVLAFVPWGSEGVSLDLMRRATNTENGTVEFLVVGCIEALKAAGVARMSLNFAVFRSVFERGSRVGAGPVLRIWHELLLIASRWWQIESLYRANAKYQPEWVPRFLCFRRAGDLPRVGLAALEAEAFIQWPRLRWLSA